MEQWRPIDGYDGDYEVSDMGRVRSLDRVVTTSRGPRRYRGKIMTPSDSGKYLTITLSHRGRARTHYVHHLVAHAFLDGEGWILHGPNGYRDCSTSNLYYGTPSQNMRDKRRDGTDHNAGKSVCKRNHLLQAPNLVTSSNGRTCLACNRAKMHAHYYGRGNDEMYVQQLADEKYASIMAGAR